MGKLLLGIIIGLTIAYPYEVGHIVLRVFVIMQNWASILWHWAQSF